MYLLIIHLLQLKELHESRNFCLFCLLILSVTEKSLNKCLSNKWKSHFQVPFPPTNFIGFGGINPLMSLPCSKICIGFLWLQKEVTLLSRNGLTSYNHFNVHSFYSYFSSSNWSPLLCTVYATDFLTSEPIFKLFSLPGMSFPCLSQSPSFTHISVPGSNAISFMKPSLTPHSESYCWLTLSHNASLYHRAWHRLNSFKSISVAWSMFFNSLHLGSLNIKWRC